MSKKLFKSLKNIHTSDIIIAGTTIVPNDTLYIFMNPVYFINNMGDIVSEYTQGHLTIYDNINTPASDVDIWDSIDYNIKAVNYQIDVSDIYLYINETTELNGYEFNIICNPVAPITVNLPLIIQSVKKVTIKNTSVYQIIVHPNASDTIDNTSSDILLNLNDIVILKPIYESNKWINLSTGGGDGALNPAYTTTFNNNDLIDGIVTITHGLANSNCTIAIKDETNSLIVPDNVTFTTTTALIDLTTYGGISGNWSVIIMVSGGGIINTEWAGIVNKPDSYPPTQHGNEAHSTTFASNSTVTAIDTTLNQIASTGLISGFDLSINIDTSKFDISAGVGIIVDNYTNPEIPVKTLVSHAGYTAVPTPYLNTSTSTYIGIDITGAYVLQDVEFSALQLREIISVGWIDHPDGLEIMTAKVQPVSVTTAVSQLNDFLFAFGSFNISGNEYHANTGLTVSITDGKTFDAYGNYETTHKSPHIVSTTGADGIEFVYYYRLNALGDWKNDLAPVTAIDPNHWDDESGTLALVPDDKWTIQLLLFYSQTQAYDFQYGQVVYDSLASAQTALSQAVDINPYNSYDTFRGWLIVKKGTTDLTDSNNAKFVQAGKLGILDVASGGGTGGEINTASNLGTIGAGIYKQKLGVDLQLRKLNAISGLTITENTDTIDFTVGGGAVTHTINNTNTATINSTDYLIRYTGTANITYNLPTATGSNRFLRFVHAGSVNTSIIVDASTNTSTLNNDTGITITKYDIGDILAIEVCDAATGKWELC